MVKDLNMEFRSFINISSSTDFICRLQKNSQLEVLNSKNSYNFNNSKFFNKLVFPVWLLMAETPKTHWTTETAVGVFKTLLMEKGTHISWRMTVARQRIKTSDS